MTSPSQRRWSAAWDVERGTFRALRRGSAQSFAVRIEREADVPLVMHGVNRRGTEQPRLLVEHCDPLRKRDTTEIHQAATRRRETWGEPAPAIRISSKARLT